MKLHQLIARLTELRDAGVVDDDSPVIVEGLNEEGDFLQASIESVTTEARCEGDDEAQAVYINLADDVERDEDGGSDG